MKKFITLFLLVFLSIFCKQSFASHLMGCDLSYTNVGPDSFKVRLSLYRDCSGILPAVTEFVHVTSTSCASNISLPLTRLPGYPIEVVQYCTSVVSTCLGGTMPGVQQYIYEGYVKLPTRCNDWIFNYTNCCRNVAITTITVPGSASVYIEAKLDNIAAPTNNSPVFTTLPVPVVCLNEPYVYNHGILEADGDSIYYTLVPCNNTTNTTFVNYISPRSAISPISSSSGFTLNGLDGDINFTPNVLQVGVFSIKANEYRAGVLIGTTQRDIQLSVYNCNNKQPLLNPITNLYGASSTSPFDLEICAGDSMFFNICGIDTLGIDTITMLSNFDTVSSNAHFTAPTPSNTLICGDFSWATNSTDVGYHTFIVKVYDNNCPVRSSITHTYTIHVVSCGVHALSNIETICQASNDSVLLSAIGSSSFYNWSVVSGDMSSLPCTSCNNFNVLPNTTTVYVVTGTSTTSFITDTVTVSVNTATSYSFNNSICDGSDYLFNGVNITSTGTYYDTLININGCDSFLTLNLTVLPNSAYTLNESICDGATYMFNGVVISMAGTYIDTITSSNGCDSIITLNLTVNNTDTIIQYITMGTGDTIIVDGNIITAAGTYYTIHTNISGCDSVMVYIIDEIVLRTSVTQTGNTLTADQTSANYQWIKCTNPITKIIGATLQSYTVTNDGVYAVIISIDSFYDTSICIAMRSIGINEFTSLKNQIEVYPNPSSDFINISYSDKFNFELIDVYGQVMLKEENQKGNMKLDIHNYAAGIYIIKLKIKDQEVIYRINKI